jgi:hypothetical protein
VGFSRSKFPNWQPSDDLPNIWLDATQTGTGSLQDTGGGSISDGETIGKWISQGSDAYEFVQMGSTTRPTFQSAGINGLSSVRSNAQCLAKTSVSGYTSMTGMTVIVVQQISATTPTDAVSFGVNTPHEFADSNSSLVYMGCCFGSRFVGGRRVQGSGFGQATGDSIAIDTPHIQTAVFNYSAAQISFNQNGKTRVLNQTFQTAGTTAALEPWAFSLGGLPQETDNSVLFKMNGLMGEVLMWKNRVFTPAELVGPLAYIVRKWNPTGPAQFRSHDSRVYSFPERRLIVPAYAVSA